MTQSNSGGRKAAVAFILVTLFIDILGIGIVIPVLPTLVTQLISGDSGADAAVSKYSLSPSPDAGSVMC